MKPAKLSCENSMLYCEMGPRDRSPQKVTFGNRIRASEAGEIERLCKEANG